MSRENDRRKFLTWATFGVGGFALAACTKNPQQIEEGVTKTLQWLEKTAEALEKDKQLLQASQTSQARPTQKPSPLSPTAGIRTASQTASPIPKNTDINPVIKETLTPTADLDQKILSEIRAARGGEALSLEQPLISWVIKIPRPFTSDAVYAVIAVNQNGEQKGAAVIDNFDCGLEKLQDTGKLGEPFGSNKSPAISGLWKPDIRFNNIKGEMFVEASIGVPAVVTGTSYQFSEKEQALNCPKKSVFSNPGSVPEKLGQQTGKLIRNLVNGFESGYFH